MEPFIVKNPRAPIVPEENLANDPRWALVERVASSPAFQRTPKLREFLLYVCETTLRNRLEDVREQQIGVRVFNRRPDYNMSEDSIVRVQARELRKRLAVYFESGGKDEPVVISIPKGAYVPVFAPRGAATHDLSAVEAGLPSDAEMHVGPALIPAPEKRWRLARKIVFGLLLALVGWLVGTLLPLHRPLIAPVGAIGKDNAFYERLLGSMGRDGKDTLVVLSNPKLILYVGLNDVAPPRLAAGGLIPVPRALDLLLAPARNVGEDPNAKTYIAITSDTYTGIGEAACAYNIGRLMQSLNRSVRLTQGRFLNWESAKREHLIVLGNPAINAWTHDNLPGHNFFFAEGSIRNAVPLPGEEAVYQTKTDASGSALVDYGIISMSSTASGSRVLTIAGREVAGTHGAGEFFASSEKMKAAYERISALSPRKPFPSNWEVLIRVNVRENIPVDTTFVACRAGSVPE